MPRPDPEGERILAIAFAPIIMQDVAAPYDEIGRVAWKGNLPCVDTSKPVVYYYISHAFLRKEVVLQINYVFWYPERAGDRAPWIEHGRLDGLTLTADATTSSPRKGIASSVSSRGPSPLTPSFPRGCLKSKRVSGP
jgi:hypothetical protein